MNEILVKQNQEPYLSYLAAQRQLYNDEKKWISLWMLVTTLVALLGSGILPNLSLVSAYLVVFSGVVMISEFAILPFIKKRGEEAAAIQELFDCELLEMPWNDYLTDLPDQDTVPLAAKKYRENTSQEEQAKLMNWYSIQVANLPLYQARVVCQKENLLWDEKQRREYVRLIIIALLLIAMVLVVMSITANWTARDFFSGPVLLILPVFAVGSKHVYDHWKAIQRLNELNAHVKILWKEATQSGVDSAVITQKTRQLQNEIYRHRADNPPVFNWFYEYVRKKYEKAQ